METLGVLGLLMSGVVSAMFLIRAAMHEKHSGYVITSCENPLEALEIRIAAERVRDQLNFTCELFVANQSKDLKKIDVGMTHHSANVSLNSETYEADVKVLGEFQDEVPRSATATVAVRSKSTNLLSLNTQRLVWNRPA